MAKHEVLKMYETLPDNTHVATDNDFFNEHDEIRIGMAYFWQRIMQTTYNASRIKKDSYDIDLRQAIQGKRVWVIIQ